MLEGGTRGTIRMSDGPVSNKRRRDDGSRARPPGDEVSVTESGMDDGAVAQSERDRRDIAAGLTGNQLELGPDICKERRGTEGHGVRGGRTSRHGSRATGDTHYG